MIQSYGEALCLNQITPEVLGVNSETDQKGPSLLNCPGPVVLECQGPHPAPNPSLLERKVGPSRDFLGSPKRALG